MSSDPFSGGGDHAIAESFKSVHPIGNPSSSSTNSGYGTPPIWSGSVGVLSPLVRSRHDFALIGDK